MADIKDLDQIVVETLDFFAKNPPPSFNPKEYELPFVVGSGLRINQYQ